MFCIFAFMFLQAMQNCLTVRRAAYKFKNISALPSYVAIHEMTSNEWKHIPAYSYAVNYGFLGYEHMRVSSMWGDNMLTTYFL